MPVAFEHVGDDCISKRAPIVETYKAPSQCDDVDPPPLRLTAPTHRSQDSLQSKHVQASKRAAERRPRHCLLVFGDHRAGSPRMKAACCRGPQVGVDQTVAKLGAKIGGQRSLDLNHGSLMEVCFRLRCSSRLGLMSRTKVQTRHGMDNVRNDEPKQNIKEDGRSKAAEEKISGWKRMCRNGCHGQP